jgi:accessory gene regulator B
MNEAIHNLVKKISATNPQFTELELKKMEYGLVCAFSDGTKFVAYFVLFYLLNLQQYFIVSALFFCSIRIFVGGYHADTYFGCLIMSFATFLAIILLGEYFVNNPLQILVLLILSIALVIAFAPVDNINKRIKSKERRKNLKYCSIIITLLLSCLCYLLPHKFLATAMLSIIGAVLMMIVGKVNNSYVYK